MALKTFKQYDFRRALTTNFLKHNFNVRETNFEYCPSCKTAKHSFAISAFRGRDGFRNIDIFFSSVSSIYCET